MSKYKILFVTMNYTIPVNGVAECNGVKFWFKYKNIDNMSDIDYNNLEYIISELSDDYYKIIYDNHQDFCKKSGKQFYHTNDDDLIIMFLFHLENIIVVDFDVVFVFDLTYIIVVVELMF